MAPGLTFFSLLCLLSAILLGSYTLAEHNVEPSTASNHKSRISRSDDVELSSVYSLVEQQATVIESLQSRLQAEENRSEQQASVIQSLQADVSSLKNRLVATSKAAYEVPVSSTLIFDAVSTNVGNGYDRHTGIFTVPVPGVYTFFLTVMSADGSSGLTLSIVRDESTLDTVYAEGTYDSHDQGATQVTAHLLAGQKVWVRGVSGAVRGHTNTVFTGFLVQAD